MNCRLPLISGDPEEFQSLLKEHAALIELLDMELQRWRERPEQAAALGRVAAVTRRLQWHHQWLRAWQSSDARPPAMPVSERQVGRQPPTVGLLVLRKELRRAAMSTGELSWLEPYRQAAAARGLRVAVFTARDLHLARQEVEALIWEGDQPVRRRIPLPAVIERRGAAILSRRTLERLCETSGLHLLNPVRNYPRDLIFDLLSTEPNIQPHLLARHPPSPESLRHLMERRVPFWIRPRRGYRQRTVAVFPEGEGFTLYRRGRAIGPVTGPDVLWGLWERQGTPGTMTLEELPATVLAGSLPFEIRCALVRDQTGAWLCAGAVVKNGLHPLSSRQPRPGPAEPFLNARFGSAADRILQQTAHVARQASDWAGRFLPELVSCCADFWLEASGHPVLVDLVGHDRGDWIRRSGDTALWHRYSVGGLPLAGRLLGEAERGVPGDAVDLVAHHA